jgi:hypothetical protein
VPQITTLSKTEKLKSECHVKCYFCAFFHTLLDTIVKDVRILPCTARGEGEYKIKIQTAQILACGIDKARRVVSEAIISFVGTHSWANDDGFYVNFHIFCDVFFCSILQFSVEYGMVLEKRPLK